MALTYDASAQLMKDQTFIGRVKVACLHFASFITGEANTTPAHNTRLRWAQNTMVDPDAVATKITPIVIDDPAVQSAGGAITDANLQTAVEAAVNKLL